LGSKLVFLMHQMMKRLVPYSLQDRKRGRPDTTTLNAPIPAAKCQWVGP
jgi:hypothetical protein